MQPPRTHARTRAQLPVKPRMCCPKSTICCNRPEPINSAYWRRRYGSRTSNGTLLPWMRCGADGSMIGTNRCGPRRRHPWQGPTSWWKYKSRRRKGKSNWLLPNVNAPIIFNIQHPQQTCRYQCRVIVRWSSYLRWIIEITVRFLAFVKQTKILNHSKWEINDSVILEQQITTCNRGSSFDQFVPIRTRNFVPAIHRI